MQWKSFYHVNMFSQNWQQKNTIIALYYWKKKNKQLILQMPISIFAKYQKLLLNAETRIPSI